jgi:ornithine cyclodeaminase/alanine dehydrogenase-like protein (mu-crystallin family)
LRRSTTFSTGSCSVAEGEYATFFSGGRADFAKEEDAKEAKRDSSLVKRDRGPTGRQRMVLLIDRKDTEPHISVEDGVKAVEEAFREFGENPSINHPRRRLDLCQEGWSQRRFGIFAGALPKSGYVEALLRLDIIAGLPDKGKKPKLSPYDRHGEATFLQESMRKVYVLYDLRSGLPVVIEYGGSGRLSPLKTCALHPDVVSLRTAATSVVGINYLARKEAATLGFLGTGGFSPSHLVGIYAVRNVQKTKVYSPTKEHRERFCREKGEILEREVTPVADARSAVEDSDIVMCCTSSIVPVFGGGWLKPGTTVVSIQGTNKEHGKKEEHFLATEVDDTTVSRSDVIVTTSIEQDIQDEQGTLWERVQRGLISWSQVHELAGVVVGKYPGRTRDDQICFFHDNAGQGVADLAIAVEHYEVAKKLGLYRELSMN